MMFLNPSNEWNMLLKLWYVFCIVKDSFILRYSINTYVTSQGSHSGMFDGENKYVEQLTTSLDSLSISFNLLYKH